MNKTASAPRMNPPQVLWGGIELALPPPPHENRHMRIIEQGVTLLDPDQEEYL